MTAKTLTTSTLGSDIAFLIPANADKHARSRLGKFARWLVQTGGDVLSPDLACYRDDMLSGAIHPEGKPYSPATVSAHLSTVRARYQDIILDRDLFYERAGQHTDDPLLRKAAVDEMIARLENAINPRLSTVKTTKRQDVADSAFLRLTTEEASALLSSPGVIPLVKLRDTTVIGLLLCTGMRESELVNLEVRDLRQRLGGELALHVRDGKGCKERLVPYGALCWVLAIVDKWLGAAGITEGPVIRGFYKGNKRLRPGKVTTRAIEKVLGRYPVMVDGKLTTVRPHDLRRTYARRLYEANVDLVAIQQNLGHANLQTTLGYIGELDAGKRRPPAIYTFDLAELAKVETQEHLVE